MKAGRGDWHRESVGRRRESRTALGFDLCSQNEKLNGGLGGRRFETGRPAWLGRVRLEGCRVDRQRRITSPRAGRPGSCWAKDSPLWASVSPLPSEDRLRQEGLRSPLGRQVGTSTLVGEVAI